MSAHLIPILSFALSEYYTGDQLMEMCGVYESHLEWDHAKDKPDTFRFARRLLMQTEHENHRLLLLALLPGLFLGSSKMISKTSFERREFHEDLAQQLEAFLPLMAGEAAINAIALHDDTPFTSKSELRAMIAKAETEVFLVDPYVGVGTLDCLNDAKHPIRLLAGEKSGSIKTDLPRHLADFRAEGHLIEVRTHPKLHDRTLMFNGRCWLC